MITVTYLTPQEARIIQTTAKLFAEHPLLKGLNRDMTLHEWTHELRQYQHDMAQLGFLDTPHNG